MEELQLIVRVVEGLGVLALVTMLYGAIVRGLPERLRRVCVGLVFGIAASLVMFHPFVVTPGVVVDARGVLLVLAAPFGGGWACLIAGLLTAAARLQIGGMGAHAGVVSIALACMAGYAFTRLPARLSAGGGLGPLLLLALMGTCQSASFFLLPPEIMLSVIRRAMLPVALVNAFGVVLFGLFLRSESNRIADAARNVREATTDPLTDLSNRRHFERTAPDRLAMAEREGRSLSVLLIDIDHFKDVNDRFGHDVGDVVLCALARTLRRNVRASDLVARLGGEEFAILLDASAPAAGTIAEKLRAGIEAGLDGERVPPVTISIGIAAAAPGQSIAATLKKADLALYEAKRLGRNRVHRHEDAVVADSPWPAHSSPVAGL